ncbi:MAG: hypothetical protein ACYTEK_22915 [Planctomycetota bacterium]
MRALFGLVAAGVLGVSVTWLTKPRPEAELKGLVAGTQMDAMCRFKGGRPNRRPGAKVRLRTKFDANLSGKNVVVVSQSVLDQMAAERGDMLYASHIRWWYGGLRSVHVKAGLPCEGKEGELMRISPEDAHVAHFMDGQHVVVEKIM